MELISDKDMTYTNPFYSVSVSAAYALTYRAAGQDSVIPIRWPVFEVDGKPTGAPEGLCETDRRMLNGEIEEISFEGALGGGLRLGMVLRVCPKTPFLRFRYVLSSDTPAAMTKTAGESLCYFSYPGNGDAERTEVRFSVYNELLHSYCLSELPAFEHERDLMGPILTERRGNAHMLTAYEHGSTYPDKFIVFRKTEEGITLNAFRGNYRKNQRINGAPYETVWLQMGAVTGAEDALARAYRDFQLHYCSLNRESRKPYIFYNTWAFQERNKFYNKQEYLSSMNQRRMETEIEAAHKMGVDVFVIDTGWFAQSGDWETNRDFFPKGMRCIHELLQARGMKLGLWFNPCAAAVNSRVLQLHPEYKSYLEGETPGAFPVWDTPLSFSVCQVSDYWKDFADRLIVLANETGVRYFKWDSVNFDGCDRPWHHHGDENDAPEERRESYRFLAGTYMSKIADRVCAAVPDAIVDMDITERGRYVGLGFLSSGKFFALNNGPYYSNYDISVPPEQWSNIFVNPGPARTWICRQNLCFDKWIPSVLLMAHYLPDDPESSQLLNLASLVMGQNGIWGDLPGVSEAGRVLFEQVLGVYKRVRDDVTQAYPVVYGSPGETFEVHEKINGANGRGLVALFSNQPGAYRYRLASEAKGAPTVFGGAVFSHEKDGLWIEADFSAPGAAILFFEGE